MIGIAILGYGTVGSGVAEVLRRNSDSISRHAGREVAVKKILDIKDMPDGQDSMLLTKNPDDIFSDPSINIVVETIGGTGAAYDYTRRALESGRHVATSNKELVALYGPELLQLAKQKNVHYLFEASVGGGIPVIRPLNQCLAANVITSIKGILNGTTNYILTSMYRKGINFREALKEAQAKGFAEADSTADVEGHDACRKLAILSSIAYGQFMDYRRIYTEGIAGITPVDMEYADKIGSVIKLVAVSGLENGRVFARVSPLIIKRSHSLAGVEDVFNAILIGGDPVGEVMFYGRGAGKFPTASAVVADIIDIVKHINEGCKNVWLRDSGGRMMGADEVRTRYFIRLVVKNVVEAKKAAEEVFGRCGYISLGLTETEDELAFTTGIAPERELAQGVERIKEAVSVRAVVNVIRVDW